MAWRGAASRTVLAAVRRPAPSAARAFRGPPPIAAPRPRLPSAFANPSCSRLAAARPLAAMMGSPVTAAAVLARLTAHPAASARACCELSQGTSFRRTCQDRYLKLPCRFIVLWKRIQLFLDQFFGKLFWRFILLTAKLEEFLQQ